MDPVVELSSPLRLPCGVVLPNRLFKSAMTEGLADARDQPTDAHDTLYRRWSAGGTGTLVTGNVMVDARYLERPGNVVIEQAPDMERLSRWAQAGTSAGNQLWMQISHPGRQCSKVVAGTPVAPSAVQLRMGGMFGTPRPLLDDEITDIVARFGRTARVAKSAGFTGVQMHSAHGYLSNQFLSPRTNRRDDRWGGSLQNRARFLLESVRAMRAAVGPDFPVAVKLNSADFLKDGFTTEECCQVAAMLEQEGVDLIELSGGTYENMRLFGGGETKAEGTRTREAYFLDCAAAVRGAVRTPLAVTGGFRTRAGASAALAQAELDVVGLARPLCIEPDLPARWLAGSTEDAPSPERHIVLGRGVFGMSSKSATIRGLNAQAQTAFFYQQIIQLAFAQPLDLQLSAWRALLRHLRRELRTARAREARHAPRVLRAVNEG